MTCGEAESQLVAASDGRLDSPLAMRLSAHLEGCAACREREAFWRRMVPGLRGLAPETPDPMRIRRMQIEVERQLAPAPAAPVRAGGRWLRLASSLGAVAAAAAIAIWIHRPAKLTAPPPVAVVVRRPGPV
jgi:anti-sigma factor RsiW